MANIFARLAVGITIVIILQSCAAQRGPSGGPVDLDGPIVIEIDPESGFYAARSLEEITLVFDERVDPVSVPGSIVFTPAIEFATRTRGSRVDIRPSEPLNDDQVYVLTLKRGIRDYNRNAMPSSMQYVFATGGDIPLGVIEGDVIVSAGAGNVEVGLFMPDTSGMYQLFQSLPLSDDKTFTFSYLASGNYRLVVQEGGFSDFPQGLNARAYALHNRPFIRVSEDTSSVALLMDTPLYEPQIKSVAWVTPTYLELTFDWPFGKADAVSDLQPTADNMVYGYQISAGITDTIRIDLGLAYNKLGDQYTIRPFNLPVSAVVDTLAPTETSRGGIKMRPVSITPTGLVTSAVAELRFSEPAIVRQQTFAQLTGRDSTAFPLEQISPFIASIMVTSPDQYTKLAVPGDSIYDYVGITLADSILERRLSLPKQMPTGEIRGRLGNVTGRVAIEALDAATGRRVGSTVSDSSAYHIEALVPGFYVIFAHEIKGADEGQYFSGSWAPYRHAARFGYYPEQVEVRVRWEVNGIDINFGADTKYPRK